MYMLLDFHAGHLHAHVGILPTCWVKRPNVDVNGVDRVV